MANHFKESDIAAFFEVFRQYDNKHNGQLHLTDVPHAMIALGHNPTEQELSKLILAVKKDADRDYFDFPEFLTVLALHLQETEPEEQLRGAFKVFDKDNNGNLSASELKTTMSLFGKKLTQEDIDYMIKTADIDGDGQVNYEARLCSKCTTSGTFRIYPGNDKLMMYTIDMSPPVNQKVTGPIKTCDDLRQTNAHATKHNNFLC